MVILLTHEGEEVARPQPTQDVGVDGFERSTPATEIIKSSSYPSSNHNGAASSTIRLNITNNMPTDKLIVMSMVRQAAVASVHGGFPFQPPHLKYALKDFYKTNHDSTSSSLANSVKVSKDDLEAAQSNLVHALPKVQDIGSEGGSIESVPIQLFNAIKDDIQSTILDGRPIVIDFGCALGRVFAGAHLNATVICVHENGIIPNPNTPGNGLLNLIHIATPTTFLDPKFVQFYDVCNFFTVVIAMYPLLHPTSKSTPSVLAHLAAVLPSSAVVFTAVPTEGDIDKSILEK
jgi:hypothetical protein